MQPMVVDLPAPLGPSRPKISPGCAVKLTPSTASRSPYRLESPSTSITHPPPRCAAAASRAGSPARWVPGGRPILRTAAAFSARSSGPEPPERRDHLPLLARQQRARIEHQSVALDAREDRRLAAAAARPPRRPARAARGGRARRACRAARPARCRCPAASRRRRPRPSTRRAPRAPAPAPRPAGAAPPSPTRSMRRTGSSPPRPASHSSSVRSRPAIATLSRRSAR